MPKPIIEIENLSKLYKIGANKERYLSLRDEIVKFASRLRPRTKDQGQSETDFWALKDVCFSVQEGEAVGIIGRKEDACFKRREKITSLILKQFSR